MARANSKSRAVETKRTASAKKSIAEKPSKIPTPTKRSVAERIRERTSRLHALSAELKGHFVGIDSVIDEVIAGMSTWYVMPEALTRPVIVNLWGMTGVGKTDLVRRIVRFLDLDERYEEISLLREEGYVNEQASVQRRLTDARLNSGGPAILLFDEVHLFRSVGPLGEDLTTPAFADFWSLLSDGRLPRYVRPVAEALADWKDRSLGEKGKLSYHDARDAIDEFGLEGSVEEWTQQTYPQLLTTIRSLRGKKAGFQPDDYSQCLIFVCGNLDHAFSMAQETSEADIDADIFHSFTKQVTTSHIKSALSLLFRPEQVARFGNVHIIYRSLTRENFVSLIEREVERLTRATAKEFGVDVRIDKSIHELVYRNGVFPAQGVRPVLSTIGDVVSNHLARVLVEATLADCSTLDLTYDSASRELIAKSPDASFDVKTPFVGRLDQARESSLPDVRANVSVHEAGHAVAYAALLGLAPLQLNSQVASATLGGFTFPHQVFETRENMLRQIQVYLAGGLAEELVFGKGAASSGRSADRESATRLAVVFVRQLGFEEAFQAMYGLEQPFDLQKGTADAEVEALLSRLAKATFDLLTQHLSLLIELATSLRALGRLTAPAIARLCEKHGVAAVVQPEGYMHVDAYEAALEAAAQQVRE